MIRYQTVHIVDQVGSIIHHVYITKHFMEIFIVCVFLPINISFALLHCEAHSPSFFILALWVKAFLLATHHLLSSSIGATM